MGVQDPETVTMFLSNTHASRRTCFSRCAYVLPPLRMAYLRGSPLVLPFIGVVLSSQSTLGPSWVTAEPQPFFVALEKREMQVLARGCTARGGALRTALHSAVRRTTTVAISAKGGMKKKSSTCGHQGDVKCATPAVEKTHTTLIPQKSATQAHDSHTTTSSRSVSSSAPWVESTLQYDVAKVQHLADVFAGAATTEGSLRTTTSVEQLLRCPQRRQGLVASPHERGQGDRRALPSRQRKGSTVLTSAAKTAEESGNEQLKGPDMAKLAFDVFQFAPSRVTDLAHELVRAHVSVKSSSTRARVQTSASPEAAEVLAALLADSRLSHYMKGPCAVPVSLSVEETLSDTTAGTLHALSIMASALEASLVALRRTATAVKHSSTTSPPRQTTDNVHGYNEGHQGMLPAAAAWRCERAGAYSRLLTQLLQTLTEELAPLVQSSLPVSQTRHARLDLLLLAVLSLMKCAEECACNVEKPSPQKGATSVSVDGFSAEGLSDQLQHLCLQVSIAGCRLSSTAVSTRPTPSCPRERFYGTASLSLLIGQAKRLQMRMPVLSTNPPFSGCLPALQSMLLVYVVCILKCMIAMDNAGMRSACRNAVPHAKSKGMGTPLDGDLTASLCLSGDDKVQLAKQVELLWGQIKPKRVFSPAEISHLQHRTVHTALNVSLATWWKSGACTAASVSAHWKQRPQHIAAILCSYNSLLTECRAAIPILAARCASQTIGLPSANTSAPSASPDLSWFVPFYSRLIRVGLDLQLEATLLAALHLDIEPRAPPTPATPIANWIKSRKMQRLRRRGAAGSATVKVKATESAAADASWARVYRSCGGVRVAATELLYCAITEVCSGVAQKPLPSAGKGSLRRQRGSLSPPTSTNISDSSSASPLAVTLVNAVSRTFFAVPRMQYLFGYYTDDTYTDRATEEECRRVYAACLGVLVWLRELAAPFGVRFGGFPTAPSVLQSSNAPHEALVLRKPCGEEWQVCGTTSAIAMDGAFFFAYYLYHWTAETGYHSTEPCNRGTEAEQTVLDAALACDDVVSGMPCPSVAHILTRTKAVEYTKEMLFQLQHDTARQLQHLRTTCRLHHFTGELQDKKRLLEDANLRQRHVTSTLSVVQAHRTQPTFLWMPLAQVQEMVFLFDQYPQLFRYIDSERSLSTRDDAQEKHGGEDGPRGGTHEYPKVHVGDITCTFARAHGYLVKRLHVLSGILREYRSILLESTSNDANDSHTIINDSSASLPTPRRSSFRGRLLDNARYSPHLEVHRRSNYGWARVWATQLHEEFPRLAAQMEGAPLWASGVVRALDRMERTMSDTHQKGLFINVVKSQQQYRELQRAQSAASAPTFAEQATPVDTTENKPTEEPQLRDLVVQRDSANVPLGLVLDGTARILRVQMKVARPAAVADSSYEAEGDVLESPFARALAHSQPEGQQPLAMPSGASIYTDVVGWRVLRVNGNSVRTGLDVAAQVQGKIEFTVTLEPC
ncbi:hypothetical protein, conserved [Leishmania tarentolae]|uniref:Uncharacterized protein n=1 Tax=Leishmania tarentolae TaxID=5689 RepID=A0A640KVH4_LEITA|nr:hypothetical protein, conserved [Leishmania tarentolae]